MSANNDRVVVTEPRTGSSGWFIAGILIAALVGFGVYYATGGFSSQESVSIELKVPDNVVPGKE